MMHTKNQSTARQQGFSLVEMLVVIVLVGIVANFVAVFVKKPIVAYVDSTRRAQLTDAADTAMRFLMRDIQNALPNSVRVTGGNFLEFVPIVASGRYLAASGFNSGAAVPLSFTNGTAGSFNYLSLSPMNGTPTSLNLVVTNLGQSGASVYDTAPLSVRRTNAVVNIGATQISFTPTGTALPIPAPASRFHLVDRPVSYACQGTQLRRFSGYAFSSNQPIVVSAGAADAVLAGRVTQCAFAYNTTAQHIGLVTIILQITDQGESVRLQQQISVGNVP